MMAPFHRVRRATSGWLRRLADWVNVTPTPRPPPPCRVCNRPGSQWVCYGVPLTREQWIAHHNDLYYQSQEMGANKTNAAYWADAEMEQRFGPEPLDGYLSIPPGGDQ